jgi:DNA-binding transcriptional LysR family regulator
MDRLTSLTAFVRVVDSGGFSAAGRKLNMSTTMVSNHVQALEDRLGARLLHRTTRKVSLTEVGKAYYDRCIQILADLEQADDVAGASQSTPRGTLRIYTATHIVPFVAPVVAEFLASFADVKVDLTMGERTIDMIDEGFDLAIRLTPLPDSSLVVRSLATWRHVLCCSPAYLEKQGPLRALAELANRNCVRHVLYPYEGEWHFVDRKNAPASVRISGNLISNSGETLRIAALQGVGLCLAPRFLVADDLESGRLVHLLPEYRPVEFAMNAVYPHRHHLSAKVRSFIDLLVAHSAEHQRLINPGS